MKLNASKNSKCTFMLKTFYATIFEAHSHSHPLFIWCEHFYVTGNNILFGRISYKSGLQKIVEQTRTSLRAHPLADYLRDPQMAIF